MPAELAYHVSITMHAGHLQHTAVLNDGHARLTTENSAHYARWSSTAYCSAQ
jgi:hypothetical protein